jgi:hypothetical protein
MKQKIQDFMTLLKRDRKTQVIVGVILVSLLYLMFGESTHMPQFVRRRDAVAKPMAPGSNEAYPDLMKAFTEDLRQQKEAIAGVSQKVDQVAEQSRNFEQRSADIFKRILERIAETEATVSNALMNNPGGAVPPDGRNPAEEPGANVDSPDEGLDSFDGNISEPKPPAPPPVKKVAIVGAGDSVRIKLLAGVDAPTDGTPYPVVFKLIGDVNGPDGSTLPLGEARLIAAAQGSLTDSRALFRLSSLNLRLPDGRRKIISVDGWVVGEDGIRGMEGLMIDPLGKAIGGAMIAGGLDGLGQAVSQQQVTTTNTMYGQTQMVTGDAAKYAAGMALSGGAREWSGIIRDRANMLVPHVQVLSGREGTAVFSKSFVVQDLYESLEQDQAHFASLD